MIILSWDIGFLCSGLFKSKFNGWVICLTVFFAEAGYFQGLFGDKRDERRSSLHDGEGPRHGDGS